MVDYWSMIHHFHLYGNQPYLGDRLDPGAEAHICIYIYMYPWMLIVLTGTLVLIDLMHFCSQACGLNNGCQISYWYVTR